MDGRQAYLRPSGSAVWSKCEGYAALCATLGTEVAEEESDNEVREDGTACHWLAAELWEGRPVNPGTLSPNGREITEEMIAAVGEYHAYLRSLPITTLGQLRLPALEQQLPVSQYFPGVTDGTPDAWSYDANLFHLSVGDLKYGFRPVDVWQNTQLTIYAWTLVCELAKLGQYVQTITFTICQPRAPHRDGTTRSWTVSLNDLAALAQHLCERAAAAHAPNPLCRPNPACATCPGAYGCASLAATAGAAMDVAYDATPMVLDAGRLGYELAHLMRAQKHIENRINGLSTQAEYLMRRGQRVPGFTFGPKATRWRWRAGAEEHIKQLGVLFDVPVMQEPKLRTVPQLRDSFPGLDVQALYAEKPSGEMTLRPVDPNEAIRRLGKL